MLPRRKMIGMPDGPDGKRLKLRFKNMISFSSIATDLQIIIAEKMDYFDQKEFGLSSKHGKEIMKMTKHRAVVKVYRLEATYHGTVKMCLRTSTFATKFKWIDLIQLQEAPELPRFEVAVVEIRNVSYSKFQEINRKAGFLMSKVRLNWYCNFPVEPPEFIELAKIFKIGSFYSNQTPNPDLVQLPLFQDLEEIIVPVNNIPKGDLLKLKATRIRFISNVSYSTINLLLQQWFQKTREIRWLFAYLKVHSFTFDDLALFRKLPYEIDSVQKELHRKYYYCYSINRGDRTVDVSIVHDSRRQCWDLKMFSRYLINQ